MTGNLPFSQGLAYLPQAFEGQPYVLGQFVAKNYYFNQVFIRYIWAIVKDFNQLVQFRLQLVNEVKRILDGLRSLQPTEGIHNTEYLKSDEIPILWCALSLTSDRYFSEKAPFYAWDETTEELITARWYALIATVFLPNIATRKLRAKEIQTWTSDFLTLHQVPEGPFTDCNICESKCFYSYDVPNFIDEQMYSQVENSMGKADPVDAIARLSNSVSERFFGEQILDASFCFVVHWLKDQAASPNNPPLNIDDIRTRMAEEYSLPFSTQKKVDAKPKKGSKDNPTAYSTEVRKQIFESVVRQAMIDTAWKYACATVMQIHDISVPEVEQEVLRRKES